jgi:hypothetical protein
MMPEWLGNLEGQATLVDDVFGSTAGMRLIRNYAKPPKPSKYKGVLSDA